MTSAARAFPFAALIGRWQLPHNGHVKMVRHALSIAETVIIVIGSAFKSRDRRNPFNAFERQAMWAAILGDDIHRVRFVQVRDFYDDVRWAKSVSAEVAKIVPHGQGVALVGFRKDATTAYLNRFPQWTEVAIDPVPGLDASALRRVYFESDDARAALSVIEPKVPASILPYLQAWSMSTDFAWCQADAIAVARYLQDWREPFYLTGDSVVEASDHVLLVQRGGKIGHGQWALPGGFLNRGERFYDGAIRELREETSLSLLPSTMNNALRGNVLLDHPLRSPRGGIYSHAYHFDLGHMRLPEVKARDDAMAVKWWPKAALPSIEDQLFEDHASALDHFVGLYPAGC